MAKKGQYKLMTLDFCPKRGHDIRDKEKSLSKYARRVNGEVIGHSVICRLCWNETIRNQTRKRGLTPPSPAQKVKRILSDYPHLAERILEYAETLVEFG